PRVTGGTVPVARILVRDRAQAARALGHVLAGHLEMNAAGDGAFRRVDGEELPDLAQHPVEGPGFVARARLDRVAVHRVAGPDHPPPLALHRTDEPRQMLADL